MVAVRRRGKGGGSLWPTVKMVDVPSGTKHPERYCLVGKGNEGSKRRCLSAVAFQYSKRLV